MPDLASEARSLRIFLPSRKLPVTERSDLGELRRELRWLPTPDVRKQQQEADVSDIKSRIRSYIEENFLFGAEDVTDETSLLDEGYIDSTSVLEIVGYFEEEFGISVQDEELVPENFGTIGNQIAYVERKTAES